MRYWRPLYAYVQTCPVSKYSFWYLKQRNNNTMTDTAMLSSFFQPNHTCRSIILENFVSTKFENVVKFSLRHRLRGFRTETWSYDQMCQHHLLLGHLQGKLQQRSFKSWCSVIHVNCGHFSMSYYQDLQMKKYDFACISF